MGSARRPRKRSKKPNRHRFTTEECRRGYRAALQKCMADWDLYAWLYYRIRGYYRRRRQP